MKRPLAQDEELLADVRAAAAVREVLHLWWLGQSGFLVAWNGRFLLFDPYLSDSLTEKYAATDKPHVRITERVVAPERLDFVHLLTSSHNHTDHLDAATLGPILRAAEPAFVVPAANQEFAGARLAVPAERLLTLDDGQSLSVAGFTLHGVAAAHEALETDDRGRHRFLGYVAECGPWRLYHAGDGVEYPGLEERLRRHAIDVALLPINGRAPERRVPGNFTGPEAADLARRIGAALAIPCHYDLFAFNTCSPQAFLDAANRLGQAVVVLQNGERWSSGAMRPRAAESRP